MPPMQEKPWAFVRDDSGDNSEKIIRPRVDSVEPPASPDARCVCQHMKSEHAMRGGVLACTVKNCACGPGCIHEGFVGWESRPPASQPEHWCEGRNESRPWSKETCSVCSPLPEPNSSRPASRPDLEEYEARLMDIHDAQTVCNCDDATGKTWCGFCEATAAGFRKCDIGCDSVIEDDGVCSCGLEAACRALKGGKP